MDRGMGGPAVSGEVALLSAAIVQLVYESGLTRSQSLEALSLAFEAVMAPPLREKLGAEEHASVSAMLDRRVDAVLDYLRGEFPSAPEELEHWADLRMVRRMRALAQSLKRTP